MPHPFSPSLLACQKLAKRPGKRQRLAHQRHMTGTRQHHMVGTDQFGKGRLTFGGIEGERAPVITVAGTGKSAAVGR